MYFAVDEDGVRTYIDNAEQDNGYYCPLCKGSLIMKMGTDRAHHFAHRSGLECDSWHYDMSEWHKSWQEKFPEECREQVVEVNGIVHRADVLVKKTVVEFQHSNITKEEFEERNEFYQNAGYKVVWLFDIRDKYQTDQIALSNEKDHLYKWKWASNVFDDYEPENQDVKVFFQFCDDDEFGICGIERMCWKTPERCKRFITADNSLNTVEFINLVNRSFSFIDFSKNLLSINNIINLTKDSQIIVQNSENGVVARVNAEFYRKYFRITEIKGNLSPSKDPKSFFFYPNFKTIYYWNRPIWRLIFGNELGFVNGV